MPVASSRGPVKGGRWSPGQQWVATQPRYGGATKALVGSGLGEVCTGAFCRHVFSSIRAELSTAAGLKCLGKVATGLLGCF